MLPSRFMRPRSRNTGRGFGCGFARAEARSFYWNGKYRKLKNTMLLSAFGVAPTPWKMNLLV